MKFPASGLYAITQTEGKTTAAIIEEVASAINGGASIIQYRDKDKENQTQQLSRAEQLLSLCQQHQVPLIINDDADLALSIGADGVHIGKDDGGIARAREKLGPEAIIGLSCYDDLTLALQGQSAGADYVAFGRFFPSSTKPLASPAHIETLQQAKQQINLPIVAIGGILPENGKALLDAGADVLAVIDGLFAHTPEQSALTYQKLFTTDPN